MRTLTLSELNPSVLVSRVAAFAVFACAGVTVSQAQQTANLLTATTTMPVIFSSATASVSTDELGYSSSVGAEETVAAENFIPAASSSEMQPPPRRGGYGGRRPRYADNSHNADGSSKWTGEAGVGATLPVGNTLKYDTDSYAYSFGIGRNFNKNVALMFQFDWDNFGLQGANLANQSNVYFGSQGDGLDGSAHVWSFSLNPVYSLSTQGSLGAYVVGGVGFFHKVTTFTIPQTGYACYGYYCGYITENAALDHYTSNALGLDGGLGLTYKFSRFANEKFFIEGRYVWVDNQQRTGVTAANLATYTGNNLYPANSNRTGYVPIKVGIRF